ncbi:MAG: NFACT RNA binding domain-containing protein [Candidatus Muiribacteriota bacterium]
MMKFIFDLRKSVNENASQYFDKAKKLKSKEESILETIQKYEELLKKSESNKNKIIAQQKDKEKKESRKHEWFEKYRWFYTTQGHLCIGGRDANTNEEVIKKHSQKNDLIFHTDMAGSPFFILKISMDKEYEKKIENKETDSLIKLEREKKEVATMTACYSKAWKKGYSQTDVFYVNPEQVTKETQSGEYVGKGSFIIKGKTNYLDHDMKLCIIIDETGKVSAAPEKKASKYKKYALIIQGNEKPSDIAKKLSRLFGQGHPDEYIKVLPPGTSKIHKFYNKEK